jgi:hypothetical protein
MSRTSSELNIQMVIIDRPQKESHAPHEKANERGRTLQWSYISKEAIVVHVGLPDLVDGKQVTFHLLHHFAPLLQMLLGGLCPQLTMVCHPANLPVIVVSWNLELDPGDLGDWVDGSVEAAFRGTALEHMMNSISDCLLRNTNGTV